MLEIARNRTAARLAGLPGLRARRPRAQHRARRRHDLHHRQRRARRPARRDRRRHWASARARWSTSSPPCSACRRSSPPRRRRSTRSNGSAPPICLWLAFSLLRAKAVPNRAERPAVVGLAAVPRGDAGQHPQPQGRALLPRLPAAIRRSRCGGAGAADPLPRPVVRCCRDSGQHRHRGGGGGRGGAAAPCRMARAGGALVRRDPDGRARGAARAQRAALSGSFPSLRGAKRRSNPAQPPSPFWIASLRSQ